MHFYVNEIMQNMCISKMCYTDMLQNVVIYATNNINWSTYNAALRYTKYYLKQMCYTCYQQKKMNKKMHARTQNSQNLKVRL